MSLAALERDILAAEALLIKSNESEPVPGIELGTEKQKLRDGPPS